MEETLVQVKDLRTYYPIKGGLLNRRVADLKAVNGVSLDIPTGQTFGLVGESGCGKSTFGRSLLRLQKVTSGEVIIDGENILSLDRAGLMKARKDMQIIFQDPYGSLNPRMTVREIVREPLDTHKVGGQPPFAERAKTGFIGLQRHSGSHADVEAFARFRNFFLREL